MSAVAPKTFNQLRFFTTAFVGIVGFYQGVGQKSANQAAWDSYYAKKYKANAEKHEAHAAATRPKSEISSEIPAELHDLVRAISK